MKFSAIIALLTLGSASAFLPTPPSAHSRVTAVRASQQESAPVNLAKLAPATIATALSLVPMAAHADDIEGAAIGAGVGLISVVVGFAVGFSVGWGAQVANVGK
mmetsp:Transcript_58939/g.118350  ORF Transcript_58939/g.118350 Transcript_58939/m.118350 type:complete len:104 (-) Transcript_58939:218-529(-)|eukprot:CAMPEP_0171620356 /NCGR_PEP_ID=MMETSP0990-20121206/15940_1 /TAXON_ID=483369 /ORGANISM="non described non described, Strain CCMP2098" /LENGTH=103 /DNA_ID=CAMNT_0012185629 /DNA_START=152 /DNA_END=463 /DNA_ORIENTATION=+